MNILLRIALLLSAVCTQIDLAAAASPTSFCKCTCFTNSTIIPLDAPVLTEPQTQSNLLLLLPRVSEKEDEAQEPVPDPPPHDDEEKGKGKEDKDEEEKEGDRKEYRAGNCNDCNRQFCLDYNLPICKKAGMEDVFTTCFQRDSRKDEAVVFIFIFATVGLLVWAAVKPWVSKWVDSARGKRSYRPVMDDET